MTETIIEKDNYGNKIYSKSPNRYEQYWTFDDKNRLVGWRDSNGLEIVLEYNDLGYPTYMKGPDGTEIHQAYENDCVHQIYSTGVEKIFDNQNRLIYKKDTDGKEYRWNY